MKFTLTEVASFIKRRWILAAIVFLTAISFGLLFQLIFQSGKPTKKILPFEKLEIKRYPTFSKLPQGIDVSSLKIESAPEKLAVFNLEKQPFFEEDAILWAKKFGITEKPKRVEDAELGKIFHFYQKPFSLTVRQDQILFSKQTKPQGNLPSLEEAVQIARSFLESKGLGEGLEVNLEDVRYFRTDSPKPFLSLDKNLDKNIDIIQIPFVKKIESLTLLGPNPKESLFYVRITRGGEIVGLKYTLLPKTTKIGDYPTINSQEAISAIFQGRAVLTYLLAKEDEGTESVPDYKVNSIRLTDAKLVYLFQLKNQTLQPIYFFWGQAKMDGAKSGEAAFYLPSLKGE